MAPARRPMTRRAVLAGGVALGVGAVVGPLRAPAIGSSIPIGVPLLPGFLANARFAVELAFGADLATDPYGLTWTWTDVSRDVLQANQGRITILPIGREREAFRASPAGCTLRLKNPRGDYTRHYPGSQYWPNVGKNIPIRVRVSLDGGGNWSLRFQGETTSLNPMWDITGNYSIVSVIASGVLRRVERGSKLLRSPLTRSIVFAGPRRHWPCEDGVNATQAGSSLAGDATVLNVEGTVRFAALDPLTAGQSSAVTLLPGTTFGFENLPQMKEGGSLSANFPAGSATAWGLQAVTFNARDTADLALGTIWAILRWTTTDGAIWRLYHNPIGPTTYVTYNGTTVVSVSGGWLFEDLRVDATQSGGNISVTLTVRPGGALTATAAFAGTLAGVNGISASPDRQVFTGDWSVGQPRIWDGNTEPDFKTSNLISAFWGYPGELATDRLTRLFNERGVAIKINGTSTTTMGPQTVDTWSNLIRECEITDGGVLADGLGPGGRYTTRAQRYNLPAALTLDAAQGKPSDPLQPTDDDLSSRNAVQVSRKNGSSAVYSDTTGPLGTASGEYEAQILINPQDDTGLLYRAALEVGEGTVDEFRYPTIGMNLLRDPDLAPAWLAAGDNSRVDITNIQTVRRQHPPGTISQMIEGYGEEISTYLWNVAANASPYAPHRVAVLEGSVDEYRWRLDSGGSTLLQSYPPGTTSIQVAVSDGYLWSGSAADWPRDLDIGGVQVTATVAPTGGASPMTFAIAASVYSLTAGSTVKLWRAPGLAL